jgi:hypothetical protein
VGEFDDDEGPLAANAMITSALTVLGYLDAQLGDTSHENERGGRPAYRLAKQGSWVWLPWLCWWPWLPCGIDMSRAE